MRVRMKTAISGDRDGQSWPPFGGEVDLPAPEARAMIANGQAVAVDDEADDPPVETAVVDDADVEKAVPPKRGPGRPRKSKATATPAED